MKETETPEAIHRRLLSEKGFDPADPEFYDIDINYLEAYHQERLKSSLPSEQEIEKEFGGRDDTGKFEQAIWIMYDYMKNKIYGQI